MLSIEGRRFTGAPRRPDDCQLPALVGTPKPKATGHKKKVFCKVLPFLAPSSSLFHNFCTISSVIVEPVALPRSLQPSPFGLQHVPGAGELLVFHYVVTVVLVSQISEIIIINDLDKGCVKK